MITDSLQITSIQAVLRIASLVYFGFSWVNKQMIEAVFEVKVETFILVGDSAGGNLVCGLTYWLIESKKQLPKFLSLCYPAMYLRPDSYSPSMLYALDDLFMNYSALRGVISSYLNEDDKPNEDPYISPAVIDDPDVIAQMPKTIVYVGTHDPLFDDAVRFVAKLRLTNQQNQWASLHDII